MGPQGINPRASFWAGLEDGPSWEPWLSSPRPDFRMWPRDVNPNVTVNCVLFRLICVNGASLRAVWTLYTQIRTFVHTAAETWTWSQCMLDTWSWVLGHDKKKQSQISGWFSSAQWLVGQRLGEELDHSEGAQSRAAAAPNAEEPAAVAQASGLDASLGRCTEPAPLMTRTFLQKICVWGDHGDFFPLLLFFEEMGLFERLCMLVLN